jgi:hypothetical protein
MKKKTVKPEARKPSARKRLKEKLIVALNKVLIENESELTGKIEKTVKKAVKKIVKQADKSVK